MATIPFVIFVSTGLGNGLAPSIGTKPLPKPALTNRQLNHNENNAETFKSQNMSSAMAAIFVQDSMREIRIFELHVWLDI